MPTILHQTVDLTEATVDTSERAIRNVVLIRAGMSLNRKMYGEKALREAVSKFEGVRSYDSHLPGTRRVAETTGWYANVRFEEGDKSLRADRFFTGTQAGNDVWAIAQDIVSKRAPATLAGLSINAVGVVKNARDAQGDYHMVESITKATSVDDVSTPAAGGTYLQASHDGDGLATALVAGMTFEEFAAARPDFVKRLQNEVKQIRLEESVRAVQADASALSESLALATQHVSTLTQERDAAILKEAEARRELAIERAMSALKLPETWSTAVRAELLESDPSQWLAIASKYQGMAKEAGRPRGRVPVEGMGSRIAIAPVQEAAPKLPLEDRLDWDKINNPADLARIQAALST